MNTKVVISLSILVLVSAVYRVLPTGILGFAPQIAMALFGGAMFVNNKKWAFVLPIASMFIGDCLFQILHSYGLSVMGGFYEGQLTNYLLFGGLVLVGFSVNSSRVLSIFSGSLVAPTLYFIVSNFLVWINGGGYHRPLNAAGFFQCYSDALPFYTGSLLATMVFSTVLFGGFYLLKAKFKLEKSI